MSIQTGSSETWRMQLTEGTACYLSLTRPSILPQIEWKNNGHRLDREHLINTVAQTNLPILFSFF